MRESFRGTVYIPAPPPPPLAARLGRLILDAVVCFGFFAAIIVGLILIAAASA